MIPLLLILIPLLSGLACFFMKESKLVKSWALFASVVTALVSVAGIWFVKDASLLQHESPWMQILGSSFSVRLDGMGQILCLLTAVAFPLIFIGTWSNEYHSAHRFFALMLLGQAGLMGVFLSMDLLLFYFFWELALIPMYFLCSIWGGEKRIRVTFKFFIYTFIGSLLMLVGILYLYSLSPDRSFSIESLYSLKLERSDQSLIFWLFFVAFAIKMPVFPFHTWQPDTYEQSPGATTMVLSGVMVKMGLFGLIRWIFPIVPMATNNWAVLVSALCVIGIIYASLIAIRQDDLKRLIAYSSIAHIGLMCLAVFANNKIGLQGMMMQMFNHGINIIGLWIAVEWISRKFGTRKISELGGLAQSSPALAIMVVLIALANIALPLTNAFIGEFLMFNGVFQSTMFDGGYTLFGTIKLNARNFAILYTVLAGIGIILAAVYTLNMIRKVFYGPVVRTGAINSDIRIHEKIALGVIVIIIFWLGIYPQPILDLANEMVDAFLIKSTVRL